MPLLQAGSERWRHDGETVKPAEGFGVARIRLIPLLCLTLCIMHSC